MNWWDKPFSVTVDGSPWAVLTDKVFLVGLQGENKLPPLKAEDEERAILEMLRMEPKSAKSTSVQRLQEFSQQDDYITLLGFPVDTDRLGRVLSKTRKEPEVSVWDASSRLFVFKCLGLSIGSKWKAFVMGNRGKWTDLPTYEFEEPEQDVFEKLMGEDPPIEASPDVPDSSPPVPDEEQFPLPDQ